MALSKQCRLAEKFRQPGFRKREYWVRGGCSSKDGEQHAVSVRDTTKKLTESCCSLKVAVFRNHER